MIADGSASKRHLVYQPQWDIDGMISCCSAAVIVRLEASYCTAKQRRDELKALHLDKFACDMPAQLRYVQHSLHGPGSAIPYNMVMAAVLRDMLAEGNVLWIATDNIRGQHGDDVHRGPFATRALATWLPRMGLADVYTGATNQDGSVQTWSWLLDTPACHTYCAEQEQAYRDRRAEVSTLLPDANLHTHMRGGNVSW